MKAITAWFSFIIFFMVVGALLFTMNSRNLTDYSLHHMLVEAVAERRAVNLGGSYSPHLQPNGDILTYQDKVYPIKQPGIGIVGGMAYLPLAKLGIKYSTDYYLASSWVTLWTTIIPSAILAIIIFLIIQKLTKNYLSSLLLSLGCIFTTTIFPYSNFPHHDTAAMLPLYAAIYCLLQAYLTKDVKIPRDYIFYSGFFLGFSFFFSMLPLSFIPALALIVIWNFGFKETLKFAIGGFVGIVPSLIYNYFVLGGLLHFPNLMGSSVDTIPSLSLNQLNYLSRYLFQPGLSVFLFAPLALVGLLKTISTKPSSDAATILKRIIVVSTFFFLFHLSSFETEGDLQYGPRYLLPLIPLWFIGLSHFLQVKSARLTLILLGCYGLMVNLLGALYGAMYKYITVYPLATYISYLTSTTKIEYPYRSVGMIIFGVSLILLILTHRPLFHVKKSKKS